MAPIVAPPASPALPIRARMPLSAAASPTVLPTTCSAAPPTVPTSTPSVPAIRCASVVAIRTASGWEKPWLMSVRTRGTASGFLSIRCATSAALAPPVKAPPKAASAPAMAWAP
jgi:hypothetical protein